MRRGVGDEVREISRSQIMENLLGHSKKLGFTLKSCEFVDMIRFKM